MKNMKKLIRIGSKGDTIIEILLSITVLSLVLSVSYALANRSSQVTRQAQERGEAQKLAEEQLEILRGYITPDQSWENNDCFNTLGEPVTEETGQCDNRGSGSRYNLNIVKSGANTYTVKMNWPDATGETDELNLSYKLPTTGDIPETENYVCSDGIDNDKDGLTDHSSINPTNPDPDCLSPTGDLEITPLPDPIVTVVVKKIPPGPGNTTPDCSNPATQNRFGATVRLQGGSTNQNKSAAGAPPTAIFPELNENTPYTATVTAPTGYKVCPSQGVTGSQNVTTGPAGTTQQLDFKIRPDCTYQLIGYGPGYWADIARRADLDNWYITLNGQYPTWNTEFIAGHYSGAPGTFRYRFSGSANWGNLSAYYWLWQVQYRQDPIYGYRCTS